MVNIKSVWEQVLTPEVVNESKKKQGILTNLEVKERGVNAVIMTVIDLEGVEYDFQLSKLNCITLAKEAGFETDEWIDRKIYLNVARDEESDEEEVICSFKK